MISVALEGEIDLAARPGIEPQLQRVLHDYPLVVLDLREVSFIDSAGLHMVIAAHDKAQQVGTKLKVIVGDGQVRRLIELAGADRLLDLATDKPPERASHAACTWWG